MSTTCPLCRHGLHTTWCKVESPGGLACACRRSPEGPPPRVRDALKAIHDGTCIGATLHAAESCVAMPTAAAVGDALEHLDAHPRDARGARRVLHDAVCMSGCSASDHDHADRTQRDRVAALRKFHNAERR